MKQTLLLVALFTFLLPVVIPSSSAEAFSIEYLAIDLPDVNIGEDLWRYKYFVKDSDPFQLFDEFTIYFNPYATSNLHNLHSNLDNIMLPRVPLGWETKVHDSNYRVRLIDPAPADPDQPGQFFSVDFIWNIPASILEPFFQNYVSTNNGQTYSGRTTPVPNSPEVPEPTSAILLLGGLICLSFRNARKKRTD